MKNQDKSNIRCNYNLNHTGKTIHQVPRVPTLILLNQEIIKNAIAPVAKYRTYTLDYSPSTLLSSPFTRSTTHCRCQLLILWLFDHDGFCGGNLRGHTADGKIKIHQISLCIRHIKNREKRVIALEGKWAISTSLEASTRASNGFDDSCLDHIHIVACLHK